MKHAGPTALDALEPLLSRLRTVEGLAERSRGVFYRRSRAYLHFHEDASGLYADIRAAGGEGFDRIRADTREGAAMLVERVHIARDKGSVTAP